MKAKKKLTDETIDHAAAHLRSLPELQKKEVPRTTLHAIRRLAKDIRKLQERGYALNDITEHLRKCGIDVTANTLSAYLGRLAPTKTVAKKKEAAAPPPKVPASKSEATPAPPRASPAGKGSFSVRPDTPDI